MEQSTERLMGEIRSAKAQDKRLEELLLFAQVAPAHQADLAAYMGLRVEQLGALGQVAAIFVLLRTAPMSEGVVEQAVWAFAALPPCCWELCDAALVEAMGQTKSWRFVLEADHVAHHVMETEYFNEIGWEDEPDAMAWGVEETRWFAECDPSRFTPVSRVVIERDEHTGQLVVALPCRGRWQVWKQRWAAPR